MCPKSADSLQITHCFAGTTWNVDTHVLELRKYVSGCQSRAPRLTNLWYLLSTVRIPPCRISAVVNFTLQWEGEKPWKSSSTSCPKLQNFQTDKLSFKQMITSSKLEHGLEPSIVCFLTLNFGCVRRQRKRRTGVQSEWMSSLQTKQQSIHKSWIWCVVLWIAMQWMNDTQNKDWQLLFYSNTTVIFSKTWRFSSTKECNIEEVLLVTHEVSIERKNDHNAEGYNDCSTIEARLLLFQVMSSWSNLVIRRPQTANTGVMRVTWVRETAGGQSVQTDALRDCWARVLRATMWKFTTKPEQLLVPSPWWLFWCDELMQLKGDNIVILTLFNAVWNVSCVELTILRLPRETKPRFMWQPDPNLSIPKWALFKWLDWEVLTEWLLNLKRETIKQALHATQNSAQAYNVLESTVFPRLGTSGTYKFNANIINAMFTWILYECRRSPFYQHYTIVLNISQIKHRNARNLNFNEMHKCSWLPPLRSHGGIKWTAFHEWTSPNSL